MNSQKKVTSHWLWDNTGLYMYFRCMLLNRKFQGNSCSTMHLYFLQNNFKSLTLLQNPFPSKWRIKNVQQGKRKLGKESRKKREWQLRAQWIKYFVHRSWKICHLHILKLQKQKFCIRNFLTARLVQNNLIFSAKMTSGRKWVEQTYNTYLFTWIK